MNLVLKIISYIGLALTLIPAFLVFSGILSHEMNKNLMLLGALAWFLTAPYWMNLKSKGQVVEDNKE